MSNTPLVERVLAKSTEPVSSCVEEVVEVTLVFLIIEATAILPQGVGVIIALGLEDEAGIQQDLTCSKLSETQGMAKT